jgi:serine/threonine protein kinase
LQAFHNAGVCHRDIKCENIFLDKSCTLKIADYGFAAPIIGKTYDPPIEGALKTKLGT